MKTVIISDTHLTPVVEKRKLEYLSGVFKSCDRVVLNGDFWDGYLSGFDEFIRSGWKELFPILKAKKTVYNHGNHDPAEFCDGRINLFSDLQGDEYEMKAGGTVLHIEHGHRIAPAEDTVAPDFVKNRIFIAPYVFLREKLPLMIMGKKSLEQYRVNNQRMKKWRRDNLDGKKILVCGHSHLQEFDPQHKFINLGFTRFGIGQYLLVDGSKMKIIDEKY